MGGILRGQENGHFLFPERGSPGGMTYRPQATRGGAAEAHLPHKQEDAGSNPAPATDAPEPVEANEGELCAATKNNGYPCSLAATDTGYCTNHSRRIGAAVDSLLGA